MQTPGCDEINCPSYRCLRNVFALTRPKGNFDKEFQDRVNVLTSILRTSLKLNRRCGHMHYFQHRRCSRPVYGLLQGLRYSPRLELEAAIRREKHR